MLREKIFLNTTKRIQPVLGIALETFDTFNVGASLVYSFAFIDNHVNTAHVKISIGMPVIGVVKTVGRGVLGDQRQNLSSAFQKHL